MTPPRPAPDVLDDEIMRETRERKEALAAEFGYDVGAIIAHANEQARAAGVELVVREVRRAEPAQG